MKNKHQSPNPPSPPGSYRYPGVTPFTTGQSHVFFGRQQDTADLYRLLRREPLVVLYGKSGLGKSSLLNAGIIPACLKDGEHSPLVIRFGAWTEGSTDTPLATAKTALSEGFHGTTFLDTLLPGDASLWFHAKTRQLNNGGRPLLIFDQFEELFSYPEAQVRAFQEELSELLNTGIPLRFRRMAEASETLTEQDEDRLEAPLDARIVFAIRSDRMHLLDRLKDYLPNVLRHCFELKALAPDDAKDAILLPARAEGNFLTPAFDFSPAALARLLSFLRDEQDGRIEGILLQMLCEHYERRLVEAQGLPLLDLPQIGDPEQVVKKYYDEKIEGLPASQRLPARRLIEDGLVSEGEAMRLTLHESYILHEFGVDKILLERLVDSRLLRSEPFLRGGYTYELSHDRLVPPVLSARSLRREEEDRLEAQRLEAERQRKLEEAQRQAEQERSLREQAQAGEQRARQRTRLALVVSLIALALALVAGVFYVQASRSAETARLKTEEAERALKERLDLEIKKYVAAARKMQGIGDGNMARKILLEAQKLDSLHQDVNKLLKELQ